MKTLVRMSPWSWLAFVLVLSACAVAPRDQEITAASDQTSSWYLERAAQSEGSSRAAWQLQAVNALLREQKYPQALELLTQISEPELSPSMAADYQLLQGEALLALDRAPEALAALQQMTRPETRSLDWQLRYRQMLARALEANGEPLQAARTRIAAEDLILQPEAVRENQESIWQLLAITPLDQLQAARAESFDPGFNGWLDLFIAITGNNRDPDSLQTALRAWQLDYPGHPAASLLPESLIRIRDSVTYNPRQIALMLPLSGNLGVSGGMVRDGFLAAHYSNDSADLAPLIRIYDTSQVVSIKELYEEAIRDGAELIVGPLTKEALEELASFEVLPVPTLGLNQLDHDLNPAHFYQFGLPVEDDAVAVAERAIANNQRGALVLNADGGLGDRAEQAFTDRFESLGGKVVRSVIVNGQAEAEQAVKSILGVSGIEQRQQNLQATIGVPVDLAPHRRQDADFVFMIARSNMARRLKPYLDYFYAYDLPVYATSHVYTGQGNSQRDNDLSGITFPDAPWVIGSRSDLQATRARYESELPGAASSYGRLFALGFDAYRLIPELTQMAALGDYRVEGLSGTLSMDNHGRIHRDLDWASFRRGEVTPGQ